MTLFSKVRLLQVCGLLCFVLNWGFPQPALGYSGGPIRAYVAGLEVPTQRVFYYFIFEDGSISTPQVWFFDLDSPDPTEPERMPSLEGNKDWIRAGYGSISPEWRSFSRGLTPLRASSEFDISLRVTVDSTNADSAAGTMRYHGHAVVSALGQTRNIEVVMFSETAIRVAGVYEIPGRPELIVVLSYRGRAYGWEDVDLPVLIPAK